MKIWIQHHDLFVEELTCVDLKTILDAYFAHDWKSELELEQKNKGSDRCCRPAFGIEMDPNHVLQIYPRSDRFFDLHYDYSILERRLFLFLNTKSAFVSVKGIEDTNLDEVLFLHFNKEHELLLEFLEAFGHARELES